jgi:hypothetical protein
VHCPECRRQDVEAEAIASKDELLPDHTYVYWRGTCPEHGRFGAFTHEAGMTPSGIMFDAIPRGWCSQCGEPLKHSKSRPWSRLAWTGWCSMCRVASWVMRQQRRVVTV